MLIEQRKFSDGFYYIYIDEERALFIGKEKSRHFKALDFSDICNLVVIEFLKNERYYIFVLGKYLGRHYADYGSYDTSMGRFNSIKDARSYCLKILYEGHMEFLRHIKVESSLWT